MNFSQLFKSKTVNFNAIVPAIVAIASALGYAIPVEVVTGVLAIGNFILRIVTSIPLTEK